jgi:hypothetical protein
MELLVTHGPFADQAMREASLEIYSGELLRELGKLQLRQLKLI